MPSSSHPSSSCLVAALGVLASLALGAPTAQACGAEQAARWVPQRSWPSACEPDAFVDGAVLLDGDAIPGYTLGGEGELRVFVERIVEGAPVEQYEGKLSFPDGTSALFKSDRPLPPSSDFLITAYRAGVDGSPIGDKFTSAFTTGTRTLAPVAFSAAPTLAYEESDRKRHVCGSDECGVQHCSTSDELEHVRSLRVAVPEITGGIQAKAYRVSAELVATFASSQAPVVATADSADTQADKRSFIVLDLPRLTEAAEGCVTIHVTDVAGNGLDSEPLCMKFDADSAPREPQGDLGAGGQIKISTGEAERENPEQLDQLELSSSSESATAKDVEASMGSAGGCAVGRSTGGVGVLGWLGIALTLARLRTRKRSTR